MWVQRGLTLGMEGGDEGRGPMRRRARRVGGKDGKEEKGAGGRTGAQKPPLPSFLPAWPVLGSTDPDNRGGEEPPAPVCRVWTQEGHLGSGEVARTDDTQGQTYPLIQIEGLWGAGQREEEEQMVNDPQVLPPVPATHPTWVGASPPRRPPRCWPASPAGLGRTGTAPGRSNRWPDRGAHSGGWGDVNGGPEGSRVLVHALPLV